MTYQQKNISALSRYAMKDIASLCELAIFHDLERLIEITTVTCMEQWKQELQTVTKKIESCLKNDEDRTKKTTLEKRLALNLTLSSFKAGRAHRHILNDRKTVDPADCFYDPSIYNMSFQGATTLLATKVSSETQHFGTTQSLKHHVHPAYGFSFSNSRLSNYADIQNEEL